MEDIKKECEHNYIVTKTTGTEYTKRCFKCNDIKVEPRQQKKKSFMDKLLGR